MRQLEFGVEMFGKVLAGNSDIEEFINNMEDDEDESQYSSDEEYGETEEPS